jgi:alkanesulfonate monooxygenase SsuD/methylene tetrahydromethanopterin reductase-like flavin-dependent oxidoreductase (luciferase family)
MLEAMIKVWTEDPVSHEGRFYRIPESKIGPKPLQKPHPQIYVAGFGQYAFDRTIRFGSAWNPAGVPSFEWLESMIKQLQETADRAGRADLGVALRSFTRIFPESRGERHPMMGTLEEVREDINRLRDLGVTELIQSPPAIGFDPSVSIEQALALMEQLIEISK